ncbi:MAG: sigma-54-dependent Fis family transcriptional regulator [Desulfobacteraceae bacterium]|nr:sigma-54-dependent Fis family transcriptional regulator [Desulfobacteraceae bacterium]
MKQGVSVLVVDDELIVRESLYHWFKKEGYRAATAPSGQKALECLAKERFDILFVDMKMPGMDGLEVVEKIREHYPDSSVVIITAYGSIDTAVTAMKKGASDYLLKPFNPDQLSLVMEKILRQKRLDRECRYLKGELDKITRFDNIIGESPEMQALYAMITDVADTDAPILILGETGTGKELVAKAIHAKSGRKHSPFIPINCGALPDTLMESELFGFTRGAFTGAHAARKGYFEVVAGGTLFLDEIGEVSPRMQVDLLRVLEEKRITKLGETTPKEVDFRLISATRRGLERMIKAGTFRQDLFFRINVITLEVPPLRKRASDISLLVDHFLARYSSETNKRVDRVTDDAMAALVSHGWPGNVRELENAVERAVVLSRSRTLSLESFGFLALGRNPGPSGSRARTLREAEKQHVAGILEQTGWNITRAAAILDISRTTLHRMIKRNGLEKP